jgi:hypothetical protein
MTYQFPTSNWPALAPLWIEPRLCWFFIVHRGARVGLFLPLDVPGDPGIVDAITRQCRLQYPNISSEDY